MASPRGKRGRCLGPLMRDRDRRMAYAALEDAADRLAASVAGYGVAFGDRIAVWLPSGVETASPARPTALSALHRCTATSGSATSMS
jgi:non-ribosomal peptide synthetase component E (peptide arylation enzyme)